MINRIRHRLSDDQGVAVVAVVILGVFLVLLSAVMVARTMNEYRATSEDRDWEQAIHVAESGVDHGLALLDGDGADKLYAIDTSAGFGGDESGWAVAQALAAPASYVQQTPEGEYVAMYDESGLVLYAVGFAPSRDDATASTRVIRVPFEQEILEFQVEWAVLADGDITIDAGDDDSSGSAGIVGNVHANGEITGITETEDGDDDSAGIAYINGDASATGTVSGVQVGGATLPGSDPVTVPAVNPRFYFPDAEFVLCPDGTVENGPANGGADEPCTGPSVGNITGWTYAGAGEWRYNTRTRYEYVIYVYQGNARVTRNVGSSGNPWDVTIITEAAEATTPEPGCPHVGGDIIIDARVYSQSKLGDLLFVAGRDLRIGSSGEETTSRHNGILLAHEQIWVGHGGEESSLIVNGMALAENVCDTSGSAVYGENAVTVKSGGEEGGSSIRQPDGMTFEWQPPAGGAVTMLNSNEL